LASATLGRLFLENDIFRHRFESLTVGLDHSNGYMPCFAGVDVSNSTMFAFMRPAYDFAWGTVF